MTSQLSENITHVQTIRTAEWVRTGLKKKQPQLSSALIKIQINIKNVELFTQNRCCLWGLGKKGGGDAQTIVQLWVKMKCADFNVQIIFRKAEVSGSEVTVESDCVPGC